MKQPDLTIVPIITQQQIEAVAHLAAQIWRQHFTPIIGEAQVRYMLKHFQSTEAIQQQINFESVEYFSVQVTDQMIGYMALIANPVQNKMMLSKLYVSAGVRGTGVGKALLDHAEQVSHHQRLKALWLTVNRHNQHPIGWYQRQGFCIVDEQQKDIGNGFVMDDFIMEKPLF
ncbi:GNAT family N-acetyltransferase [Hydrogenovibrio sp. SC-1]|uniref:GNAT family N-acetyltransferase n=1 Tax=Hydrogenovibrio sp. SC-1 TaxID=2065820 RepID=UPI000C79DD1C|nr:GNAT family N-acetyltransferase [Hydrogenovibrio sp. SC-1]PLA74457.1 GNAT family N-acetyltransferase [Hydrogenovibrio sp. SC-1]